MVRRWMLVAGAGFVFASSCGDENALPAPPAACDLPADFLSSWSNPAAASTCGPLKQRSGLGVRQGVAYFATEKGICAIDAAGARLIAEHPLGFPPGGPWTADDGLLAFDEVAVLLFPFPGGDPTIVATVAGANLEPSVMAAAYDGRFVYGTNALGLSDGALWRIERNGLPEILSHLERDDGEADIVEKIVPAADHVDTSLRFGERLFRTDLATGVSRPLFDGEGTTYLLGGDGDSAYVRDAINHPDDPNAYWSDRNMSLFRIDGAGVKTRVLDGQTPLVPTAVMSIEGRVYAAGKLTYAGSKTYHGLVALTPSGTGADLLACVPAPGDSYSSLDTAVAITVEGDFIYVLLAGRAYDFAIVRVAR